MKLTNIPGAERFADSIGEAVDAEQAALLRSLLDWAVALETDALCELESGERENAVGLYPRLGKGATIAYAWNLSGRARLYVNGTVIAHHTPRARSRIEAAAGRPLPNANMRAAAITDELLDALTQAYREAAGKD